VNRGVGLVATRLGMTALIGGARPTTIEGGGVATVVGKGSAITHHREPPDSGQGVGPGDDIDGVKVVAETHAREPSIGRIRW
jgi:hypothetical protein